MEKNTRRAKPAKVRAIKVGDLVEKNAGDYQFSGTVVVKYRKLSGAVRYVVEDDRGINMIYSEKNLTHVTG